MYLVIHEHDSTINVFGKLKRSGDRFTVSLITLSISCDIKTSL